MAAIPARAMKKILKIIRNWPNFYKRIAGRDILMLSKITTIKSRIIPIPVTI